MCACTVCICVCVCVQERVDNCVSPWRREEQGPLSEGLECVQLTVSLSLSVNRSLVIISAVQAANIHIVDTHNQTPAQKQHIKLNINHEEQ